MKQKKLFQSFRDNYYQDYSRKIVQGADEKAHVEYVYEGIYYAQDVLDRQWYLYKLCYMVLTVLGAAALLSAMCMETTGNYLKDMTMLQAVSLFLFLGAGVGACSRLAAPRRMTRWEYRMGVVSLREFSQLLVLCLSILLADGLVSGVSGRLLFDRTGVIFLIRQAVCLLVAGIQYRFIKNEHYLEQVSEDLPHGIDITNDFESIP